jgi:hypothetical protein
VPLPAGPHQPGHPQLGQVLRDPCRRLADHRRQLVDRQLPIQQRPQQLDPGPVGEHPEHLDGQVDLVPVGPTRPLLATCIHT